MTDTNNAFYVLNNRTYEVMKTGIPMFNPGNGRADDYRQYVRLDCPGDYSGFR